MPPALADPSSTTSLTSSTQHRVFAITITGGHECSGTGRRLNVPKRDLIATTSLILEQRRLRIAEDMRDTDALIEELLTYHRRIISENGTETFSAPSGGHDDLVIALSLALWLTENRSLPDPSLPTVLVDRGEIPGIVAMGDGRSSATTEPQHPRKTRCDVEETPPKSPHQTRTNYAREPSPKPGGNNHSHPRSRQRSTRVHSASRFK